MNLAKQLLLVLITVLGLCSCGSTDSAGRPQRAAPLIQLTYVKSQHNSGSYRPARPPMRSRFIGAPPQVVGRRVILGATTPYLRVGTYRPDPRARVGYHPPVRPVIIGEDAYSIHLRLPDGRIVCRPRQQRSPYGGNYPGAYARRDPYERYVDPRSYGPGAPSSRAVTNPMNGSWDGFRRNPANRYLFGR